MTLSAGTRLGPYEIISPLGAGGMGEVYRARDTKLDRDVAVKVLPSHFAEDAQALARFEREAKAIAALSHPNILAIFDFGRQDGTAYAVTELLEGETLRARLAAGPLPVRRAIEYAVQIARGLAAAHGKGIVHRDLKPENLFVTSGGHVKILDFGLARVIETGPDGTHSPTAVAGTEPGTVMGTVGYMSPEQVRGKPADHRSDIFSFGAVLYEMLSGRRAFSGESPAETMAAIAKDDPPEVSATHPQVAPSLDRVVQHCLEKNPAERFKTADDLAFALTALSGESTPRAADAPAGSARRLRPGVLLAALGAAALAAAAYFLGAGRGSAKQPAFHRLTFRRGVVHAARFSADGRTVVYSAAWQGGPPEVYSTRIDGIESRSLGLEGANLLALSRSDEMAVARNAEVDEQSYWSVLQGTLASVPLAGGSPRELLPRIAFADYGSDGKTLTILRGDGAKLLESPAGKVLYRSGGWISNPRVSPRDGSIAFLDHRLLAIQGGDVCVLDPSGKKRVLASGFLRLMGLAWSRDGSEVWFTGSREGTALGLHAVSLAGKERLVYRIPGALTLHDVSPDGRVLLSREEVRRESRSRGPGQPQERDISWLDYSDVYNIADDGTVMFVEMGDGGGQSRSVYIRKSDGSPATLVATGTNALDLSRDGKWMLTISGQNSPSPKIVLVPTGSGQSVTLETAPMVYQTGYFGADAKKIYFLAHPAGAPLRWYVQDVSGGSARPITPEHLVEGAVDSAGASLDGNTLVMRNESGEALLLPIRGGTPRKIPGFDSHNEAVLGFSRKGALYVAPTRGLPRPVFLLDPATGARQHVIDLMPPDPAGVSEIDITVLTPDADAYAYSYIRRSSDLYVVDGLR